MTAKSQIALEKFLSGYNCTQSVLYAFGPERGLEGALALKLATGLGAGVARHGEVCGAVTGGILALGLKWGRGENQDRTATEQTYRQSAELMRSFEKEHGSCLCRVLVQGCDFRTAEGRARFKELDLLHKTCLDCVRSVCESLEELMECPLPAEKEGR